MRRNNKKILLGIILLLITITSIFLISNKKEEYKELPKLKIKEQNNKKQFALMLEQDNGDYQESDGELPTEGYVFNKEKSSCTDINGKKIDGILDYDYENYIALLDTSKTSYCYLYYDIEPNISYLRSKDTDNHISKELTGGMYRYQGLYTDDVRNYICLGENCCNTEECSADTNDSMYRIIGINAQGELKVIKKTALTNAIQWWSDNKTDIKWAQSLINQKLNGKNENSAEPNLNDINSYYYSLNENLKKVIINNHPWLYGYRSFSGFGYNGDTIYEIESGKSEALYYNLGDSPNKPTGKYIWNEQIEAPLGIIYLSDYFYAYKTNEVDAGKPESYTKAVNGWIHLSHNEATHPTDASAIGYEWTMNYSRLDVNDGYYHTPTIAPDGHLGNGSLHNKYAICPTFYLVSNIELTGDGTLSNPFRIF